MTKRYLVGGPPNSGKSTYVLSATKRIRSALGRTALAFELDVWSGSYAAFEGKYSFKDRPKKTGLDWDWKTPLDERLAQFNAADADVVFGDLPGAKIDAATDYMCANAKADGAIVVSRTRDDLKQWREAFEARGIPVVLECLSMQGDSPLVLRDMGRIVDPSHPDVALPAARMLASSSDDDRRATALSSRFLNVFRQNYTRRSRTAHGRDENLGGPLKKPLMVTGPDLKHVAMRNGDRLAQDVLATPRPKAWDAAILRAHCERWFAIANEGICGPGSTAAAASRSPRSCGSPTSWAPRSRCSRRARRPTR